MQYVQYNVFSGLSIRFQVAGGKPLEGGITSRKSIWFYFPLVSSWFVQSWKFLKLSIHVEKSLNSVKVLEKYLISLLRHEESLKFTTLSTPATIFCKTRLFYWGKFGPSSM